MAAEVANPPYGLVSLFADFSLLGGLLTRPGEEWAVFLRSRGANVDHVETSDIRLGDLYGQMAHDARQLCWRLNLITKTTTKVGLVIAKIGAKPAESRGLDESRVISETLAAQIEKHYLGYNRISLTGLLQSAARRVARAPGNWAGYCPGLLLGEVRHLIPLAYEKLASNEKSNDKSNGKNEQKTNLAERLVAEIVRIRIRVLEEAGMRTPDPGLTWMQNVIAYADVINGHHLGAIAEKARAGLPTITQTEARATAMLLTYAGLLVHLQTLGPVHCLGPPDPETARPPRSPLDPVPVTLADGSVWDRGGLNAGLVAQLMILLVNDEVDTDESFIFPNLHIDKKSRKEADNLLNIAEREIAQHRTINRALAMEELSGLLLARLDSAREVLCNFETRHGLPHYFAGGGLADIEAAYEMPGTAAGFQVIGEVSAKRDISEDSLLIQLEQAYEHGKAIAERTGQPVYALVLSASEIASNEKLADTYRSFAKSKGLDGSGPVRLLAMDAWDLAAAVRELEVTVSPDAFRFGADILEKMFDTLIGRLLDPELRWHEGWMREVCTEVVRDRTSSEPNKPSPHVGKSPRP